MELPEPDREFTNEWCKAVTASGEMVTTDRTRTGMYRKKPVVIEAYQFVGHDSSHWPLWLQTKIGVHRQLPDKLIIPTLEGEMTAREGDWIIKGVQGEIYPCKPDIFEATYEAAP